MDNCVDRWTYQPGSLQKMMLPHRARRNRSIYLLTCMFYQIISSNNDEDLSYDKFIFILNINTFNYKIVTFALRNTTCIYYDIKLYMY
ncbi:ribulose-1,5-bisphosphate carboxylase/oxygenase large subunit [Phtheirospermum japonicum]|uniref:Ribulose bisphosphate carboxylase large chain n=1 Tax=Phtheirospermum japonicum TaxID=374723 RepID=A0A830C3V3_9LAMI|nr:ribulose-1,5-bisphosphate carboxylase/oxygenase large subunit [Phtheirospermum japonicum]